MLLDQVLLKYADATPPTAAITSSASGETAKGPVTFSFTFSEDVGTSFTADDIAVAGGTAGRVHARQRYVGDPGRDPACQRGRHDHRQRCRGQVLRRGLQCQYGRGSLDQAYDTKSVVLPGLPITFDDPAVTYTLTGFGGAEAASVAADPAGGAQQGGAGHQVGHGRAVGRASR